MYNQQNQRVSDGRRVALLHRAPTAVGAIPVLAPGLVSCCPSPALVVICSPERPALCPSCVLAQLLLCLSRDGGLGWLHLQCSVLDLPAQGCCSSVTPKGMVRAELSALTQDLITYFLPHTYI